MFSFYFLNLGQIYELNTHTEMPILAENSLTRR